jgi:hypothetical protein
MNIIVILIAIFYFRIVIKDNKYKNEFKIHKVQKDSFRIVLFFILSTLDVYFHIKF